MTRIGIIRKDGAEKVMGLPLNEEEKTKFHACASSIRANMNIVDHPA